MTLLLFVERQMHSYKGRKYLCSRWQVVINFVKAAYSSTFFILNWLSGLQSSIIYMSKPVHKFLLLPCKVYSSL